MNLIACKNVFESWFFAFKPRPFQSQNVNIDFWYSSKLNRPQGLEWSSIWNWIVFQVDISWKFWFFGSIAKKACKISKIQKWFKPAHLQVLVYYWTFQMVATSSTWKIDLNSKYKLKSFYFSGTRVIGNCFFVNESVIQLLLIAKYLLTSYRCIYLVQDIVWPNLNACLWAFLKIIPIQCIFELLPMIIIITRFIIRRLEQLIQ